MKFWAVLLFSLAVPSELPGYLFGAMRYPFLVFVAAIGAAEALYAIEGYPRRGTPAGGEAQQPTKKGNS
ncbi:MAG: hypothetical protein ACXWUB_08695 [Burkholderiales bacterium]